MKQDLFQGTTAQASPAIGHPGTAHARAGMTDDGRSDLAGTLNQTNATTRR